MGSDWLASMSVWLLDGILQAASVMTEVAVCLEIVSMVVATFSTNKFLIRIDSSLQ